MHSARTKLILFSLVGVFNTAFDITVYVLLLNVTHSFIIANVVATSLALTGSYLLNSRITFKSKHWSVRTLVLFVVVTIFGLWVLQTGTIYILTTILDRLPTGFLHQTGSLSSLVRQLAPKLGATAITFVWNYLWYNQVIFRGQPRSESVVLALDEL